MHTEAGQSQNKQGKNYNKKKLTKEIEPETCNKDNESMMYCLDKMSFAFYRTFEGLCEGKEDVWLDFIEECMASEEFGWNQIAPDSNPSYGSLNEFIDEFYDFLCESGPWEYVEFNFLHAVQFLFFFV